MIFSFQTPYRQASGDGIYNPGLFKKRLPQALLQRIEALFGRETAPQYPTARATALSPYGTFCTHLNPALSFWHGAGLTIWFLTQGPYSRTDIPGMPEYYQRDLEALAELGCPINSALFADLVKAKVVSRGGEMSVITVSLSSPGAASIRRTRDQSQDNAADHSFRQLKEIYLRHLRDWTERYFETFWREHYRRNMIECGRRYNRLRETTGRTPSLSKFVDQEVATVINEYFGGNVYRFLEALGDPLPERADIRDEKIISSVEALEQATMAFAAFRLRAVDERLCSAFVDMAIRYCVLWEGRGSPPTRSAFSSSYYYQELCKILGADPVQDHDKAWAKFSEVVEQAVSPALQLEGN